MKMMEWLLKKNERDCLIAPLVVYRILFGMLLFYACLWSISKEDISIRYLEPTFYFKYYGFEWVGFIGVTGIYWLYGIWLLAAVGIMLGAFYRVAMVSFLLVFTYLQLLDATNYINHYYAISILAMLLCFLPAHAACSIDVWRKPSLLKTQIPSWNIAVLKIQVGIIYTFAAIAKMNMDWVGAAMPLKIWLLQSQDFPLLGGLFQYHWMHVAMSWAALLFDLTIVWFLLFAKTRKWAYGLVLIFHVMTGLLLNIGLFPLLMVINCILFFDPSTQEKWLHFFRLRIPKQKIVSRAPKALAYFFSLHILIQLCLPMRHYFLYTGNPLWTEEGARFAWRVMLVEKDGLATFYVEDPNSTQFWEVNNLDYLTPFQEKRMAVRPDHILQFAQYLAQVYGQRYNIKKPIVRAKVHVALNGRLSQELIDSSINLAEKERSIWQKDWILPLQE